MCKFDIQRGYYIKLEIENLKEVIKELKNNLSSLGDYKLKERVQGGNNSPDNLLFSKVNKILELEKKLEELINFQYEALDRIEKVENEFIRMILRYRYINNYTFEVISEKLNCSVKTVIRKHKEALKKI